MTIDDDYQTDPLKPSGEPKEWLRVNQMEVEPSDEDIERANVIVLEEIKARTSDSEAWLRAAQAEHEAEFGIKRPEPERFEIETIDWTETVVEVDPAKVAETISEPVKRKAPKAAKDLVEPVASRPLEGVGHEPVSAWMKQASRAFSSKAGTRALIGVLADVVRSAPYETFVGIESLSEEYGFHRQRSYAMRAELVAAGYLIVDGKHGRGRAALMRLTLPA